MSSQRPSGQPPPHKRPRISHNPNNHPPNTNNHHRNHLPPNTNSHHRNNQQQRPRPQQQNPPRLQQLHRLLEIQGINLLSSEVQKWIYQQCALSDHIEIEAKLGKLLTYVEPNPMMDDTEQKGEEIRVHDKIGLKSLAWIDLKKTGGHFESTVDETVFKHLNVLFNNWYANCNSPPQNRLPQLRNTKFPKLLFKRSRTVDKIYQSPGDRSSSIRVTLDMNNGARIKEVIEKKKKASMNICCPGSKFDIRISASVENIVPKPQRQIVSSLRCKDRISYQYDYFSIDITTTYTYCEALTPQFINDLIQKFMNKEDLPLDLQYGTQRTYEVELEIADHEYLRKVRKLAADKKQTCGIEQLSYFFTQAAIKMAKLASAAPVFVPSVCKLPGQKK
eukprot:24446_1